ncbi:hypothetical protein [Parasitella parasitica]|uniref:CCHC-type domain-containing protein n=1 Tax=Parasitella parasitica TaxID=35722 RepID=A0A0B7NH55_9FUNG|nr:hypothetical protein [Parasitella parasitica]
MNENETVSAYVERFEKKRTLYNNEIMKRKLTIEKTKKVSSGSNEKDPVKQEALNNNNSDTIIELIITEAGFMKCFLKGLLSKSLKREIKGQKFNNVDQMLSWIKEMYESDESDNSRDDSGNDSDDEDQALQTKLQKFNKKTAEETNKSKMEETFESVMNNMSKDFSNMVLLIGELNTKITNNIAAGKKKKSLCYNCQGDDHYSNACTAPCKLCGSKDHKHYQCHQYKNNSSSSNSKQINQTESMLIEEEIYLSEKRKMEDDNANSTRTKRPDPKQTARLPARPIDTTMTNNGELNMSGPSAKALGKRPMQRQPEHPLLPIKQPGDDDALIKTKAETIIDNILNEPAHRISILELAEISNMSRPIMKARITKPQMEDDNPNSTRTKRPDRKTRSGKVYSPSINISEAKQTARLPARPIDTTMTNNGELNMSGPSAKALGKRPMQRQPEHPLLPIK